MPRSRLFGALAALLTMMAAPPLAVGDADSLPFADSTSLVADRLTLAWFLDQLLPLFERGFGTPQKRELMNLTEQLDQTGEGQTVNYRVVYAGREETLRVSLLPARGAYDATFYASQQVTAAIHSKFALLARNTRKRAIQ